MTAFFIATATLKNADKFKEYGSGAGATIKAHGGQILVRGKIAQVLSGRHAHEISAVAQFPDMESLNNWYTSPEYQALIPLRDAAADMNLVAYSQPK